MPLEQIVSILNKKIGLNPGSIGTASIERAINHRISCRNCINITEYSKLLALDSKEVRELIEEVVVPETWFFRNKGAFEAFREHVKNELLSRSNKRKPIRILSIPCATGEEPYSLAMALMEENIDPRVFRIDAMDVSKKAIALAKDAHYGKNSFRDVNPKLQAKYFTPTDRGWLLDDKIKKLVKFKQGNILSGALGPHPAYYDVVFCRNLMIYFDRKTQQSTLQKILRVLKKGAILFVGHAECAQVPQTYFQQSPYQKSFSFIKRHKPLEKPLISIPAHKAATPNSITPGKTALKNNTDETASLKYAAGANKTANRYSGADKNGARPNIRVIDSLRPVEKLANQGRYQDAEAQCGSYLKIHPESAQGHYLLGLIKNSQGDQKTAESLLKKAIYLDPNHEQALVLSALIAEQKGDSEAMQAFKRRIERVQKRKQQS